MEDDAWQMRAPYHSLVEALLPLSRWKWYKWNVCVCFSFFLFFLFYRQDLYRDCVIYQPGIFVLHQAKALIKGKKYVRVHVYEL